MTLVIHWVGKDLAISEEFLGLYALDKTDAESIPKLLQCYLCTPMCHVLKNHTIIINNNNKVRGQCYDGCSTMAVARWLEFD